MVASSRRLAVLALLIARSSAFSQAPRFGRTTVRLFSSNAVEEMRAGEIKKELESYGISTKSFLEKEELVNALLQARAEGKTPKASEASTPSSSSTSSSSSSSTTSSSSSSAKSRDDRLAEEMEACKAMKAGELKKELEDMGISTKSFFEKAEFIKALAVARVDGVTKKTTTNSSRGSSSGVEDGYAEYKNVEVLTDDSAGPRKKQSAQPQARASPFGGGGMPDMGSMGGMGGIADMLKNMGGGGGGGMPGGMGGIADMLKNMGGGGGGGNPFGGDMMGKAQEMLKNPKVREIMAKAQSNPKIMAAVQECMSNPAAFAKYQNDPEVGGLINELKKYMM